MKCCEQDMRNLFRWDDAQETDHCYNLYTCENCGDILKEDVGKNKGTFQIDIFNCTYDRRFDDGKSNNSKL